MKDLISDKFSEHLRFLKSSDKGALPCVILKAKTSPKYSVAKECTLVLVMRGKSTLKEIKKSTHHTDHK
jgi:hypothetical protein